MHAGQINTYVISFKEYFVLSENVANIHTMDKGDKLTLNIGGMDIEFKVLSKQKSESLGTKPVAAGEGYGHYVNLEPTGDFGTLENISPQTNATYPTTGYNIGTKHNIPLDTIKQMLDGGKGKWDPASEVAAGTPAGAQAAAQPGYGQGQSGPAQNSEMSGLQRFGHDVINKASAETSAKSVLGGRVGRAMDNVARDFVGTPVAEPTGASVYAKDGKGGTAHGQRAATGNVQYDKSRQLTA
jgi:hypothetical protein